MKIEVTVKTNARKTEVEALGPTTFRVSVNAPPQEGRANEAVCEALAAHFNVAKSRVQIVRGHTSKKKLVDVALPDR
jgi:uncharacterized protein (TIGR00251 family)